MSEQPKCHESCYTNGKGCAISQNGQCLHLFDNGNKSQPYKSSKDYYSAKKESKWDSLYYKGTKLY